MRGKPYEVVQSPEECMFRRAPEGWVFTAPGLLPGDSATYLVNDAQKAELVARLERWRKRSDGIFWVLWLPILSLWAFPHYDLISAVLELFGIHSTIVVVTIVGLIVVLFVIGHTAIQLFVIRSVLTDAVATPIKLGFWDRLLASFGSLAQAAPFLGFTVFFLTFAFLAIDIWHDALTSNDWRFSFVGFRWLIGLLMITVGAVPEAHSQAIAGLAP